MLFDNSEPALNYFAWSSNSTHADFTGYLFICAGALHASPPCSQQSLQARFRRQVNNLQRQRGAIAVIVIVVELQNLLSSYQRKPLLQSCAI